MDDKSISFKFLLLAFLFFLYDIILNSLSSIESSSLKFPSRWYIDKPCSEKYFSIFDGSITPHNPNIFIIIIKHSSVAPLITFWSNISTKFIFSPLSLISN